MIPALLEMADENEIHDLNFVDGHEERESRARYYDGNSLVSQQGSDAYYMTPAILGDYAQEYYGLDDPSIKRLYYPTIVYVKDGVVVDAHYGTVDSQTDAWTLSDETQKEEFKNALREMIPQE